MANFNKPFNARGGFQVDTETLCVRGQRVGIGSTEPTEVLDVKGVVKAQGLELSSVEPVIISEGVVGVLTVSDHADIGIATPGSPAVRVTLGVISASDPNLGVVTYYGNGENLLNLPTSQWVDINVGLGFTSIYAQGFVGVNTTDPRYPFQVGGVPFPNSGFGTVQTGVGIQSGSIFASDNIINSKNINSGGDISAGGEISAASSISAGGNLDIAGDVEINGDIVGAANISAGSSVSAVSVVATGGLGFIGVGSQITFLDADSLEVGSIGSERYGPLIVTDEIIAPRLTGVASFALGIATGAEVDVSDIVADTIFVEDQLSSLTGKITVGSSVLGPDLGSVDVFQSSGTSDIYCIAETATSRIFAGNQRPSPLNLGYGGLRFGGNVPSDPLSNSTDLDVVNYDVGNLNFYLHSGSSGVTAGEFRWIYSQSDTVLAALSPTGNFSLLGDLTVGQGGTTTGNWGVGGQLFAALPAVFDSDLLVKGDTTFEGALNVGELTLEGGICTKDLLCPSNPQLGGQGVGILTSGTVTVSNSVVVYNSLVEVANLGATGLVLNGSLEVGSNAEIGGDLEASNIEATNTLTGANGFTLNSAGLSVNDLTVNNSVSLSGLNITNATITTLNSTTINADGLTVNGTSNLTQASIDSLNVTDLVVTNAVSNLDIQGTLSSQIVSATTVNATNVSIASQVTGNPQFTGTITASALVSNSPSINLDGTTVQFQAVGSNLQIIVDGNTATIPFDP